MRLIFKSVPKLIWPRNRISLLRRAARFSSLRHYVTEKAWESCNSKLQAFERRTAWRWRGTRRSRRTSRRTYLYGKNALLARQLDKRLRVSDFVEQHVLSDFQICLSVTLLDRISYSRFHDLIRSTIFNFASFLSTIVKIQKVGHVVGSSRDPFVRNYSWGGYDNCTRHECLRKKDTTTIARCSRLILWKNECSI